MTISAVAPEPIATEAAVSDHQLRVTLTDGREVTVPLEWFPRLRDAMPAQRANWRLIGQGEGIQWPDVDEDILVAGLLRPS